MVDGKCYLKTELDDRLQRDPDMWEFLQKGSLDGIWYWDLEHPENEWMSPEFWRLFGIDPASKRHDPAEWQDIIFPEDLAVALENLKKHCADPDHPYDQVVRYRHADDSTVWVRCRGIAIRDDTGKPIRMLGAHNDHTALKRAEANARFGQLFMEAPIAMLLTAEDGSIREANTKAGILTGYDLRELRDMTIEALVPSDIRAAHSGLRADPDHPVTAARVMAVGRDVQLQRRDGSLVPVRVKLVPHKEDELPTGDILAAIVDLTNITEVQKAHERLEHANRELLRSNRELDDFAYTASHDLKEPLRGIAINANFLAREDVSEKGRERIDRMLALTKRMEHLISDILFFSRLGRGDTEQEDIDPVQIIEGVTAELQEWMSERDAAIRIETKLPILHAERSKVKTVFQNLIVNGLKYNDAQCKTVDIGYQSETVVNGATMHDVFYIHDNGIGIAEANRDKIFRLFARLNRECEYGSGTGAGLSFVRKIVEDYGCEIALSSEPDAGTTFYFSLPLARAGNPKLTSGEEYRR